MNQIIKLKQKKCNRRNKKYRKKMQVIKKKENKHQLQIQIKKKNAQKGKPSTSKLTKNLSLKICGKIAIIEMYRFT